MSRRLRSGVRYRLAVLIALVVVVWVPLAGRAPAQNSDSLDQIKQRQDETTAEIAQARQELQSLQSQHQDLQVSVNSLTDQLTAANARLAQAQLDSDRYAVASLLLSTEVAKTEKKLEVAKEETRHTAVLAYQRGGNGNSMLDLIGSADGAGAVVEGTQYLEHVASKEQHEVDIVSALRTDLSDEQTQLTAARKAADEARDQAASEQQRINALQTQQQQALDGVASNEASYNTKLDALAVQQAKNDADFQAESDRIAASLAALSQSQAASTSPSTSASTSTSADASDAATPSGNGMFIRPIPGAPITSGFGYRTDPITGQQSFHPGIDFGASCGTPIHAAGNGQIVSAGFDSGGYGNMTIIDHGGGIATLYGHQSSIAVSTGQTVTQGQVIGYVGTTGRSTGCHLHWEVRVNGNPVNPLPYL